MMCSLPTWGDTREATPEELKFREYEWKWLRAYFCNPDFMHSLGSRSLARVAHEANSSDSVDSAFAYVTQKTYSNHPQEHERVREESQRMLVDIAREQYPELADIDLHSAIGQIDQTDPYVRARVWGTVYPPRGSWYRTPMMGAEGHSLLGDTPSFRRPHGWDAWTVYLEEQLRAEREHRAEIEKRTQTQLHESEQRTETRLESFQRQQQAMMDYMMMLTQTITQAGRQAPVPPTSLFGQTPSSQPHDEDLGDGGNPSTSTFGHLDDLDSGL